ncbi:HTTM domain-containing protein [Tenacibaculum sp. MEBiC06402]
MCLSIIRFWYNGWVEKLYITPKLFFSFYGFEWVKPFGIYTYLLFIFCGLSAFFVAIGYKYRIAIISFFLSFTYIELMDKTTYLNHYYFVSLVSFLMIFLPANATFSVDSFKKGIEYSKIPKWTVDSIKFMLGIVYFYAGLAKLNSDWLFRAQPLKIWLPSKYDLPLIGNNLMQQDWFHFAMSWSGAIYDLCIPFLLLFKRTRIIGFVLVVVFHVFTRILFPIGMFPYIMIVATMIFFEPSFHEKVISFLKEKFNMFRYQVQTKDFFCYKSNFVPTFIGVFIFIQLLFPWRYLLYPGELFWTEEGYRFSWRVMLMEKVGYSNFKIVDGKTKQFFYVDNKDFLTSFQEKQMSFQPDFILEYAHFLGDHFTKDGHQNVQVYVESYVALNGRPSKLYIDPNVDLYKQKESFKHKDWILPFNDEIEIKGL